MTVARDFQPLCFVCSWASQEQAKKFCELFCFCEDIRLQSSKFACLHSQRLRGHAILALCNPQFSYFQNVSIGYASHPTRT